MKTRRSMLSTIVLASLTGISGCMSDASNADNADNLSSPAGVWFIQSTMSDEINHAGTDIITQMSGRQLVVLEETGRGEFRLHDCTSNFTPLTLSLRNANLRGAYSLTDQAANTPYNESGTLKITIEDNMMSGHYKQVDRNLDGSWDSEQSAYFEGHRISAAQTLEALSRSEIHHILGSGINRSADTRVLGTTCAGVASVTTDGTVRAKPATPAVADLLRPERQPEDLVVATDIGR